MARLRDLTGKTFGNWTVIGLSTQSTSEKRWDCRCVCGTERAVVGASLKKGTSKSCGCTGKDWCRVHGMEGTPIYAIWAGMKQRCTNPHAINYPEYGGRGIKVCERWNDFANFYEDMGDRPEGMSLDRYPNNDGDYELGNVRWATSVQQGRNKRTTRRIDGESTADLAEAAGISRKKVLNRLAAGYSPEQALSTNSMRREGWKKRERIPRTHCLHGHLFDVENTQVTITAAGNRKLRCRACGRIASAKAAERVTC